MHGVLHRARRAAGVADAQGRAGLAPITGLAGVGSVQADHGLGDQGVEVVTAPPRQAGEAPHHIGPAIGLLARYARRIGRDVLERRVRPLHLGPLAIAGEGERQTLGGQPANLDLDALGARALDRRRRDRAGHLGAVLAIGGQRADQGPAQQLDLHAGLGQVGAGQPGTVGDQVWGDVARLAHLQRGGLGIADIGHQPDRQPVGRAGAIGRLVAMVLFQARRDIAENARVLALDAVTIPAAAQNQVQPPDVDVGGDEHPGLLPARAVVVFPLETAGIVVERAVDGVGGRRTEADVATVQGDQAAVEALASPAFEPAMRAADQRLGADPAQIGREGVGHARLADLGVGRGRIAVADEAAVLKAVVKQLQLDGPIPAQVLGQVEIEGLGVGPREVGRADIDGAAVQLGRAHARVQGVNRVGRREAVIGQIERAGVGVLADLSRRQSAVVIGVDQAGVPARDVDAVVDQVLGQTVPARRLHVAVRVVDHAADGRAPATAQVEVGRQLQRLVTRIDALVVAVAVLGLAIDKNAAPRLAQGHGRAELTGDELLVVVADGGAHLPFRLGQEAALVAGGLRDEIDQPPDLASAIDRGRRAAQDLDARGPADRSRIGPAVLHPLEAAEIVLGQGAANIQRPGHAVEAGGVGPWRDLGDAVQGQDAVSFQRHVTDEAGRAGRLDQRLGDAEHGLAGLPFQQARLVPRHDHHGVDLIGDLILGARGRGDREAQHTGGQQGDLGRHVFGFPAPSGRGSRAVASPISGDGLIFVKMPSDILDQILKPLWRESST